MVRVSRLQWRTPTTHDSIQGQTLSEPGILFLYSSLYNTHNPLIPLPYPVTDKHSESGADDRYAYAVSEMQGWRVSESLFLSFSSSPIYALPHMLTLDPKAWRMLILHSSN
jgi:hypothetical protein